MKNNFVFLYFITLIMLLTSCTFSVQPFLKSIEFIDCSAQNELGLFYKS